MEVRAAAVATATASMEVVSQVTVAVAVELAEVWVRAAVCSVALQAVEDKAEARLAEEETAEVTVVGAMVAAARVAAATAVAAAVVATLASSVLPKRRRKGACALETTAQAHTYNCTFVRQGGHYHKHKVGAMV